MKKILLMILALLLAGAPLRAAGGSYEKSAPMQAVIAQPAVNAHLANVRLDRLLGYQSLHMATGEQTRGQFDDLDLTPKEAVMFIGLLLYDLESTSIVIMNNAQIWDEYDQDMNRDYLYEALMSLREGLALDLGADLEGVQFLADTADYVDTMTFDEDGLLKFQIIMGTTLQSLSQVIIEEFGIPYMDYADFGYWLADISDMLDTYSMSDAMALSDEDIDQVFEHLQNSLYGAAYFYSIVAEDARVVNAVKRAMDSILELDLLQEDGIDILSQELQVLQAAVVGGAFEKQRESG